MKKLNLLTYPLVAVLSLAAAGVAFAEDITPDNTAATPSLKTREQVQRELYAARADGSVKVWATSYNPLLVAKSTKSRAEVKADRDTAYDQAMYGEDSGSFAMAARKPARIAPPQYAGLTK